MSIFIGSQGKLTRATAYESLPTGYDEQGALMVSQMHGECSEACMNGRMFYASTMDTGVITTVDLAAIYTGISVSNPIGNTKKLIIRFVGFSVEVAGAALLSVFLSGGHHASTAITHTTPLVWGTSIGRMRLGGSEVCTAVADSSCTFPTTSQHLLPLGTVAATPGSAEQFINTAGMPVLLPGAWVCITTSIVTGAAGLYGSFIWEEVDI